MPFGRSRYSNYSNMPSMLFEEYVPFELSLTEDTYEEVEIQMPIPRDRNQIPAIHAIEVEFSSLAPLGQGAAETVGWHLSKRSKTDWGLISDTDILFSDQWNCLLSGTPANFQILTNFRRYDLKYPVASPHVKLFFGALANQATTNNVLHGRICYTMRYVSRSDIMEALMD